MTEIQLKYLGHQILAAREKCNLTQLELSKQTGLSVKTIQDIEKGCKNPTYKTLARLITRLGIHADTLLPDESSLEDAELQQLIGKFRVCNQKNRTILLNTLNCLSEQLLANQDELGVPD